jgi:hypothetical protein
MVLGVVDRSAETVAVPLTLAAQRIAVVSATETVAWAETDAASAAAPPASEALTVAMPLTLAAHWIAVVSAAETVAGAETDAASAAAPPASEALTVAVPLTLAAHWIAVVSAALTVAVPLMLAEHWIAVVSAAETVAVPLMLHSRAADPPPPLLGAVSPLVPTPNLRHTKLALTAPCSRPQLPVCT